MTTFLRFPDVATFQALLPVAYAAGDEMPAELPPGVEALVVCGAGSGRVLATEAVMAADCVTVITPATWHEGFHVNLLGDLHPTWEPYVVTPDNPQSRIT